MNEGDPVAPNMAKGFSPRVETRRPREKTEIQNEVELARPETLVTNLGKQEQSRCKHCIFIRNYRGIPY